MNIIILEDSSKSGLGGGQKVTLDVISILRKYFNLFIYDTAKESHFTNELQKRGFVTFHLFYLSLKSNSKVLFFFEYLINILLAFINSIIVLRFIKKQILNNDVIIYSSTKNGLFISFILNKFFSYNFLYHAHLIENRFVSQIVTYLSRNAFKVICVSDIVANQFSNILEKISIISNSICLNENSPKSIKTKKKFIVATISTLNKIKGIEYFVDSYRFLKSRDVIYHIYGDGPLLSELSKNVTSNIIFKGHLNDVRTTLLNKIDILIVPSIIQESFGIVILESFSCGVPVIATNVGMQSVHIKNSLAGEIVELKNAKDIAEKIDLMLSFEESYFKYSENGLQYVKKYDFLHFSNEIIHIFKSFDKS